MPRVLLSSVFKPFGVDDMYSRRQSKVELFHNQLTLAQGPFSIRTNVGTHGIHVIANNIEVPTTVLDFPTLERFRREVKKGYDVVGIGALLPNFQKVKRMAEDVRELSPKSTLVLGGFCATDPMIDKVLDVDYVCVGEGITFMRDLLGLSPEFEFKNPRVDTVTREIFGVPVFGMKNPQIIVGLGCSYGCDFCNPSHFFGKRHIRFFKSGKDLFEEMLRVERSTGSLAISFIGDDNFLLDQERAEDLRKCVIDSGKAFSIFMFATADKIIEFGIEKLAEMGAGFVWIGRESGFAGYRKNQGIDLKALVAEMRSYGIKTIMSSIILMDGHTRENIHRDIDDHLACRPAFSQFCHYSPAPGTPLYDRLMEEGRLLTNIPYEECHGFRQPWIIHPEFTLREGEKLQQEAFRRDFLELGPSIMRHIEAEYEGWQNLKDHPKSHLRARAESFAKQMWKYKIILLATEHLAPNDRVRELAREIRGRVEGSFGRSGIFERTAARGLHVTGRIREIRTSLWGDTIQPRTNVVRYNQD